MTFLPSLVTIKWQNGRTEGEIMSKTVAIIGLGLIGGSFAKAFKRNTDCRVIGFNRTRATAEQALRDGAIDP